MQLLEKTVAISGELAPVLPNLDWTTIAVSECAAPRAGQFASWDEEKVGAGRTE